MAGPSLSDCEPLARSVLSDNTVIKVEIRPSSFFFLGGVFVVFTLCALSFSGLTIWADKELGSAFWTAILCLMIFGALAVWMLGIAIKRPVALRMDRHGISGFYADPATWDEIEKINVVADNKGNLCLGFALCDPVGFRDRQTPWRRFSYWSNNRGYGHHVMVPPVALSKGQAENLVTQARQLKANIAR